MQIDVQLNTDISPKHPLRFRNARDAHNRLALLGLAGAGATVMYFLDPERGKHRRHLVRDQLVHVRHMTEDALSTTARDLKNRTQGLVASTRSRFENGETEGNTPSRRPEFAQTHWTPATRLLSGLTGTALTVYALRRRGPFGSLMGIVGTALLTRGLTNLPIKRLTGVGAGRRAVDVRKTITVHAPVERVFPFFTEWENWPQWMSHVQDVRVTGSDRTLPRTHWVVDGPAGTSVEWDAMTTSLIPNEELAWKSVEGSTIQHSGVIRFTPTSDGATTIGIHMSYNPPAGAIGHAVATFFGRDPKHQLDDDLVRLKTTIETGTPPHDAAQSSSKQRMPLGTRAMDDTLDSRDEMQA
jgi:uncharacterized membrane protein